ncbi:endonuclease-reverse transcriptase [Plakobranchus ocellatus]|uniref:Endonuclease-reverse transcriptase n=1 Tax=Plakobranchus ocellatus TaxID=259542 RepID=A0AAV4BJK0_9GAST|nr:endonuclease-reverse transcriptase [Plakobranchus ocellatus]
MIIERALEMLKDIHVYLCFIDYTKAFDRVKHWEMIKQLKQLHVDGKDLRIIKNIYWQQIAAVRIENEISPFQMIKRGVRQGCVLSPDLFNLYSETILRKLDEYPGIRIGGRIINNLRYADDTVLIAENKEDLQKLIDIAATESKRMGLEFNNKKTEVMIITISRRPNLNADVFVDGTKLKQRDSFRYLGTIITQDGKSRTEIKARIAHAKTNFQKMKPLLTNNKITITTRKRALQCYIEPILMYGCEAWTITKEIQKKIEAAEMWFFRRMLRVPWTARKTNEEVLKETESIRSLMSRIRRRQAKFVGHIMRRLRRIREPCYNWKNGGEEEQRKTKRENAGWHDFLDGDKESDGRIVGILGSRELEGHDRQRQGARHLMMMTRLAKPISGFLLFRKCIDIPWGKRITHQTSNALLLPFRTQSFARFHHLQLLN